MNAVKLINNVVWDDEMYYDTLAYLTYGDKPNYLPARLQRFQARAEYLDLDDNGNIIHDNKLLIPENKIDEVLTKLYRDPVTSINSRDKLYEIVSDRYVGISRRAVQDFLLKQEAYQIHLPSIKHKVVKPIVIKQNLQHHSYGPPYLQIREKGEKGEKQSPRSEKGLF